MNEQKHGKLKTYMLPVAAVLLGSIAGIIGYALWCIRTIEAVSPDPESDLIGG